jgi:hypothetical protein
VEDNCCKIFEVGGFLRIENPLVNKCKKNSPFNQMTVTQNGGEESVTGTFPFPAESQREFT